MQAASDWGAPRPPEWGGPKERLVTRIPVHLANDLRRLAAENGVPVSTLVNRLLSEALDIEDDVVVTAAAWPSAVDSLIR
jgi:hypothetical protein